MLQGIEITDYQSHKQTVLELSKGLNIISGTSDSGKTAVLRALLWAIRNRPMGEGFKNWDAKDTDAVTVALEFDDSWMVKTRTKNKNMYETENGTYEALRADVPAEIEAVHRLKDCNIQTQLQPYFLLQDSPGERGKVMNKLVGLDIIDRVAKKVNGKVKTAKDDINRSTIKIASLEQSIEELPDLAPAEALLNKLTHDIDSLEKMQEKLARLTVDIDNLHKCNDNIDNLKEFLAVEPMYDSLVSKVDTKNNTETKHGALNDLINQLFMANRIVDDSTKWLAGVEPPYLLLQGKIAIYQADCLKANLLGGIIGSLEKVQTTTINAKNKLETLSERYVELLGDAGECPLCHSVMSAEALSYLETKL